MYTCLYLMRTSLLASIAASDRAWSSKILITRYCKYVLTITSAYIQRSVFLTTSLLKLRWKTLMVVINQIKVKNHQQLTLKGIHHIQKLIMKHKRNLKLCTSSHRLLLDHMVKNSQLIVEKDSLLRCRSLTISQIRKKITQQDMVSQMRKLNTPIVTCSLKIIQHREKSDLLRLKETSTKNINLTILSWQKNFLRISLKSIKEFTTLITHRDLWRKPNWSRKVMSQTLMKGKKGQFVIIRIQT